MTINFIKSQKYKKIDFRPALLLYAKGYPTEIALLFFHCYNNIARQKLACLILDWNLIGFEQFISLDFTARLFKAYAL